MAKRFSTTAEQAGLGDGLADRAVLDLALQLLDARPGVATLASPKVRSLRELLQDPEVESWASSLLGCLSAEQVDLLAVRLSEESSIQRTAARYHVHRDTLRARLEAAGHSQSRSLLDPGSGPHDVLFALIVKGHLPLSLLPDPLATTTVHTAA
ncbi:helix-turn-helix domain-containing protein [Streptomyces sp. NBC_01456]|uniref:helix-turn-helix domain-containing protein n=1 Tax=unclassified Streptomyces TaxID=2593676 RepID=UPI002E340789|nr:MULTISPECIES: helix-turn-helix domain-containing protein [unclassified Streptomyces]